MIDPRTQWIIYKDKERELLLEIQWRQSFANEKQHALAEPWYTHATAWLSRVVRHIQPEKRKVEKATLTCCPACVECCPAR